MAYLAKKKQQLLRVRPAATTDGPLLVHRLSSVRMAPTSPREAVIKRTLNASDRPTAEKNPF